MTSFQTFNFETERIFVINTQAGKREHLLLPEIKADAKASEIASAAAFIQIIVIDHEMIMKQVIDNEKICRFLRNCHQKDALGIFVCPDGRSPLSLSSVRDNPVYQVGDVPDFQPMP